LPIIPRANPGEITQLNNLPQARNQAVVRPFTGVADAVGNITAQANEYFQKEKKRNDITAVMKARRELSDLENETFDPENPDGISKYKGTNALGANEQLVPKIDQRISDIRMRLSASQQEMFDPVSFNYREGVTSRLNNYMSGEHEKALGAEQKALMFNMANDAKTAALNGEPPEIVTAKLAEAVAISDTIAEANGLPEAVRVMNRRNLVSGHHLDIYTALVGKDYEKAGSYLMQNRDAMLPEAVAQADALLRPLVEDGVTDEIAKAAVYGGVINGRLAPGGTMMTATPDLINQVIHQESRGNPNAVSPKGANGLMQVMPATGASPGLGVKPLQNNSPEENVRFGTDYLNALLRRYNGNVPLALAAYNGGYGRLDKLLNSPKTGGDPDRAISMMPPESRDYVQKIMGKMGGGQEVTLLPAKTAEDAEKNATFGVTDKKQKAILGAKARREFAQKQGDEAARDKADFERMRENVVAGNKNFRESLGADFAKAQEKGWTKALQADWHEKRTGELIISDPLTVQKYIDMAVIAPSAFIKDSTWTEMMADRANMSTGDIELLQSKWRNMRDPKKAAGQKAKNSIEEAVINEGITKLGWGKGNDKADKKAAFKLAVTQALDAYDSRPDAKPMDETIARSLVSAVVQRFAADPNKAEALANRLSSVRMEMSTNDRKIARQYAIANGNPDPDDFAVTQAYVKLKEGAPK